MKIIFTDLVITRYYNCYIVARNYEMMCLFSFLFSLSCKCNVLQYRVSKTCTKVYELVDCRENAEIGRKAQGDMRVQRGAFQLSDECASESTKLSHLSQ